MLRFVRPDTVRLPIDELGDDTWILVKRELTYGEERRMFARLYTEAADGKLATNPLYSENAIVLAYLLDWSDLDHPIRGVSREELEATLDHLDPASMHAITRAVDAHLGRQRAAREDEKKTTPIGASAS
jgi:hypothetical protein